MTLAPSAASGLGRDAATMQLAGKMNRPDETLASRNPLAFLQRCRAFYHQYYRDYSCTFVKQELIGGTVGLEQEMAVKFREEPYSVNIRWVRNADDARHVVYIADRWKDDQGLDQAWCEPAGPIARLFVSKIKQPIHGGRANRASRRTIDQFGFGQTLDLIIIYNERAAADGVLDLRYMGESSFDGRPTYLFERRLPYTGQEHPYPDRLLVIHIDQQWLVPTACYSYADEERQQLLGKYLLKDAVFNRGYTDADFDPADIGGVNGQGGRLECH